MKKLILLLTLMLFVGYFSSGIVMSQEYRPVEKNFETPKKDYSPYTGDCYPTREYFGDTHLQTFMIRAMRDPDGANLERIQIIKGCSDGKGESFEKVYNVAWSDDRKQGKDGKLLAVRNTVNVADASYTNSIGDALLMGFWKDPGFDLKQKAFYYVRILEIPQKLSSEDSMQIVPQALELSQIPDFGKRTRKLIENGVTCIEHSTMSGK